MNGLLMGPGQFKKGKDLGTSKKIANTVRVAVVTTPYSTEIYVACWDDFRLIAKVGKDSINKKRETINTLSSAYKNMGLDVVVKFITATEEMRRPLKDTLKRVVMNNEPVSELAKVKQEYINSVCEAAFGT